WLRIDRAISKRIFSANDSYPLLEGTVRTGRPGRVPKHLFLLSPVNLVAPEWELSLLIEEVCVRALHVGQARAIAALHFSVASTAPAGAGVYPPWWKPKLVMAMKVDEPPPDVRVITAQSLPLRYARLS